ASRIATGGGTPRKRAGGLASPRGPRRPPRFSALRYPSLGGEGREAQPARHDKQAAELWLSVSRTPIVAPRTRTEHMMRCLREQRRLWTVTSAGFGSDSRRALFAGGSSCDGLLTGLGVGHGAPERRLHRVLHGADRRLGRRRGL